MNTISTDSLSLLVGNSGIKASQSLLQAGTCHSLHFYFQKSVAVFTKDLFLSAGRQFTDKTNIDVVSVNSEVILHFIFIFCTIVIDD